MFKISVLYPNKSGAKFDVDYYSTKHFSLVTEKLNPLGLKGTGVEKGIAGGAPGEQAPFLAVGYMLFETLEQFQQAMGAHGKELMADIPNFTDVQPIIQVSEIVS